VDQVHPDRLHWRFSSPVRPVRWRYAQAPSRRAGPPANAHLRGPSSDSPGVPSGQSHQSAGRRRDRSMREGVDRKCAAAGLFFRGRRREGRRQKNRPELPRSPGCAGEAVSKALRQLCIRYGTFGVRRKLSEHGLACVFWRYRRLRSRFRACRPLRPSAKSAAASSSALT
jgi:hypothetical protein